jgi:hypothetical protein
MSLLLFIFILHRLLQMNNALLRVVLTFRIAVQRFFFSLEEVLSLLIVVLHAISNFSFDVFKLLLIELKELYTFTGHDVRRICLQHIVKRHEFGVHFNLQRNFSWTLLLLGNLLESCVTGVKFLLSNAVCGGFDWLLRFGGIGM